MSTLIPQNRRDTDLARQVREIMDAGQYVTEDITNAVVAERLSQLDCRRGFLLDGYPRTLDQVRTLTPCSART